MAVLLNMNGLGQMEKDGTDMCRKGSKRARWIKKVRYCIVDMLKISLKKPAEKNGAQTKVIEEESPKIKTTKCEKSLQINEEDLANNDYERFSRKYIRRARTLSCIERDSHLAEWDVAKFLHKDNLDFSSLLSKNNRFISGNRYTLELPRNTTKKEKESLSCSRFKRRHAIQIEKTRELNEMLKSYVSMKQFGFTF